MIKKLSVSQIVSLLVYQEGNIKRGLPPAEILLQGKMIHSRLGFSQVKVFSRFFPTKDGEYLISGLPDRLSPPYVEELKTFSNENVRKSQEKAGHIQSNIYCWLVGLTKYKLHFFDLRKEEIVKIVEGKYNKDKLIKDITRAIYLQQMVDDFTIKYQKKKQI